MKKFIALTAAVLLASAAQAQSHKGGHHHHRPVDVVTPMIIGTVIGYGISQANKSHERHDPPVQIIHQPPVQIIHQPPIHVGSPRIIPLERPAQPVYDRRTQYEPSCSCYIEVLVQTGWR